MSKKIILAVDFDDTIVAGRYPEIGSELPLAIDYLKQLQALGVKFILWTCRDGLKLNEAAKFLRERGIELWGVNKNPDPPTNSPKAYFTFSIDDRNVGTKLDENGYVDWAVMGPILLETVRRRLL